MRQAIGSILVIVGIGFYTHHLGEGGSVLPRHLLWLLAGGLVFFVGFWLSVPDRGGREASTHYLSP